MRSVALIAMLNVAVLLAASVTAWGQTPPPAQTPENSAQPPAQEVTPDVWPKTAEVGGATFTLYQPQVDSWDGYNLEAHCAVSVQTPDAKEPVFGVVDLTAKTDVDRVSRTVEFHDITFQKVTFPSVPDKAASYQQALQEMAADKPPAPVPLDHLQAALAIEGAEQKARMVPVKNEPPAFVFSQTAAVLISIDGEPVWTAVEGAKLKRILNTRALVLQDASGKLHLHLFDGFMEAPQLSGPWTVAKSTPAEIEKVAKDLAKKEVVDLLEGPVDEDTKKSPSLKDGTPEIVVATKPTELIVTEGQPKWVPIEGTMLLYAENTTANLFKHTKDQQTYVLVTGRWFRAASVAGPWQYVTGKDLPPDFAQIADDCPKENVKASVPGTPQAREALIADEIPQTAQVNRKTAKFTPHIDGQPQVKAIAETPLSYVVNTPAPIIKVDEKSWYACENGVWFVATSVHGPWIVATEIPAVIYSIPPSSPLHYVTYVKVYRATPEIVTVGYTPGYLGTVVAEDDVVVYGTGYYYPPYIGTVVWYPPPVTYGYAVNVTWTPWTGWAFGYGFGWGFGAVVVGHGYGWGWGPAPYWGAWPHGGYAVGPHGAVAWGPHGWAATTGNVYHHWGSTTAVTRTSGGFNAWTGDAWSKQVGHSYNSTTGRISAGQRGAVQNVYTGNYAYGGRGATYNPRTGTGAVGGRVTVGNERTGQETTLGHAAVKGPAGQTTHMQEAGNNYYAERNGNVYRNTGDGWQHYDNGSWNNVQDSKRVQSLQSHENARQAGAQRSAGSSWGGQWGGGFQNQHPSAGSSSRSWGGGNFAGSRGGNFGGFRGGGRR